MNFILDSATYGAIRFKTEVPPSLAKWVLQGGRPFFAEGPFGNILFQKFSIGSICWFYSVCHIAKDLALDIHFSGPVSMAHIAIRNESSFEFPGSGIIELQREQFNLF